MENTTNKFITFYDLTGNDKASLMRKVSYEAANSKNSIDYNNQIPKFIKELSFYDKLDDEKTELIIDGLKQYLESAFGDVSDDRFTKKYISDLMNKHICYIRSSKKKPVSNTTELKKEAEYAYNQKNYVLALKNYRELVKYNDPDAFFNLAVMYENGYGVKTDFKIAEEYYLKAINNGNTLAKSNLNKLNSYQTSNNINYENLSKGDTIKFGRYNGNHIEWIVLENEGRQLFLLSKKILCEKIWDNYYNNWNRSNIRAWLNNEFYDNSFSSLEKSFIINNKEDNVSLLSVIELTKMNIKELNLADSYGTYWWLRTSVPLSKNNVWTVNHNVEPHLYNASNSTGVRPVIHIKY